MSSSPLDSLSDDTRKRRLLDRLASAKKSLGAGKKIPRLNRDLKEYPLSFGQQRLHYLSELHPESPAYHIQVVFEITGTVDIPRLTDSVRAVVMNHGTLHSVIVRSKSESSSGSNSELRLQPRPDLYAGADLVDLSSTSDEQQSELVEQAIQERFHRPFYLDRELSIRTSVLRLSSVKHMLVMTFHHIAVDERSIQLIIEEIAARYRNNDPPDDPDRLDYIDFAAWQKDSSSTTDTSIRYWCETLQEPPEEAPVAPGHIGNSRLQGRSLTTQISRPLAEGLRGVAKEHQVTPFMLLFAAFNILLRRYSGASDLVVGTPVSNRNHADLAEVVGFFIETLPLRTSVSGHLTFPELLRRTQTTVTQAFQHSGVSFEEIVKAVNPPRRPGRHPLFNVMFVSQTPLPETPLGGDLLLTPRITSSNVSKFDLTLFVGDLRDHLDCTLEFNNDVLSDDRAEQFLQHWLQLLKSIVADPTSKISALSHLTDTERSQLRERSEPAQPIEVQCVHETIQQRCLDHPDAIAVRFQGNEISYADMNARSDVVAKHLRGSGVGADDCVLICVDRSVEMVIGILGILKSGGAYVPVDPKSPSRRIAQIVKDCRAFAALVQSETADVLGSFNGPTLKIAADGTSMTDAARASESAASSMVNKAADLDSLAYVIYTSGSTGMPKGVEITHRNLALSTFARKTHYHKTPQRFLLLSSYAFDSSIAGIFWTLCSGGTLVLPSPSVEHDVHQLGRLIEREQITHSLCLPSFYELLLDHADTKQLGFLTTMIVAGESCPSRTVSKHFRTVPDTELHNEYGPTEATVWATVDQVSPDRQSTEVTIGKAVEHTHVYLLDDDLQPVPPGAAGELFIGGPKLARGYRHRPDLTAQSFIPHPFSADPNERLYRTGDRARQLDDGRLVFLGRVDNQLKINGHRIEPEEIEAAIASNPKIRDVVVGETSAATQENLSDQQSLLDALGRLPPEEAEKLLAEAEANHSGGSVSEAKQQAITASHSEGDLSVTFAFPDEEYIATPRARQRKWLIDQALRESSSDLQHLRKIASSFVPGSDKPHVPQDIRSARLSDQEIMEDWQQPLMQAMADYATATHGDVLEIGFGRGVSATMIQRAEVKSHTIIEANPHSVADHFHPWLAAHPEREIRLVQGRWQDVLDQLTQYDAVFFHAFPLNESEFVEYIANSVTFAEHFFATAAGLLRQGGVFTYLTTEIDSVSRRHQRGLFEHFSEVRFRVQSLNLPEGTKDAWWANSMVVLQATK